MPRLSHASSWLGPRNPKGCTCRWPAGCFGRSPAKIMLLVIDHSGATYTHGFVEEPRQWTLDPDKKVRNLKDKASGTKPSDRLCECKNCGALRTAGEPCGNCGYFPRRAAAYLHIRDGQLYQLERDGIQANPCHTRRDGEVARHAGL